MASEVGVYDVEPENIVQKGRLRPGRMLLVDMEEKSLIRDEEMKRIIAQNRPHGEWWGERLTLKDFVGYFQHSNILHERVKRASGLEKSIQFKLFCISSV